MAYKPELPAGVTLPPGFSVNTADPRYVALHSLAEKEGWTQESFSGALGIEAKRVSAAHASARAAAPSPAPKAGVPEGFSKLPFRDKMAYSLQQNAAKRGGV
jgi:hypothetical protein